MAYNPKFSYDRHKPHGKEDCKHCKGRGIVGNDTDPDSPAVALCVCMDGPREGPNAWGPLLLNKLGRLDPTWKKYIDAVRSEKQWPDWKIAGAFCAYVLERGLHMTVPAHPAFNDDVKETPPEELCRHCEKPFVPAFPGQAYCGQACGVAATPKPKVVTHEEVIPEPAAVAEQPDVPPDLFLPYDQHDQIAE